MSAAAFLFTIFLHIAPSIFKAESVENHQKTRNSTTILVDNYVDGVDRPVNMHQKAKNIYTSTFSCFVQAAAWQIRHNCKTNCDNRLVLKAVRAPHVIANTQPNRNNRASEIGARRVHVIKQGSVFASAQKRPLSRAHRAGLSRLAVTV